MLTSHDSMSKVAMRETLENALKHQSNVGTKAQRQRVSLNNSRMAIAHTNASNQSKMIRSDNTSDVTESIEAF